MSRVPSFPSKLPGGETTIFTIMSALAKEHNAINLGQGFPNFDTPARLKKLVSKYVNSHKNQYCSMAGLGILREALAVKLQRSYACKLCPDSDITVIAGATQGLFTAIHTFVHPGDEVVIIEPAYDSYRPSIRLAGGTTVPYSLREPEFKIDWSEFASKITKRTRMIIINTPHNPSGKTLKHSDMQALERLVADTDILILSDEVYQHLVYDGRRHESVLRYPELFARSISVFSFGKTFHSTGWKLGYCVAPDYLTKEFRKVHQWNVFCVNSFLQYALAEYVSAPANYELLPSFYQKKRNLLTETMNRSRFIALPSEGTFFQLYNYRQISKLSDIEFCKQLTTKHGVAAIPLSPFYLDRRQTGIIRLCFAKTDEVLIEAGKKLANISDV